MLANILKCLGRQEADQNTKTVGQKEIMYHLPGSQALAAQQVAAQMTFYIYQA